MTLRIAVAIAVVAACLSGMADTTLMFPEDCALGTVYIDPLADGAVEWFWAGTPDWHEVGEARGAVSIPDGCRTMLKIGALDARGYKLLRKKLKHTPLDRIQIEKNNDLAAGALPAMETVKELMLGGDDGDAGDASLAALKNLPNLEFLSVSGNGLTAPGVAKIGDCTSLRGLGIRVECPLSEDTIKAFRTLQKLEGLTLQAPIISNSGLAHLAAMPALRTLDLTSLSLSSEGYTNLCKVSQLAELTIWCQFTATDAAALAPHPTLQRLSLVQLVDDATFANICDCKSLRTLTLACGINEGGGSTLGTGLTAIAKLENLEVFSLGYGRPPAEFWDVLANMKHLKKLYVSSIPNEGLERLGGASTLEELTFGGHGNSHQSIMHLSRIKGLKKLKVMCIQPETIVSLQEVLPDLEIRHRRTVYPPKNPGPKKEGHSV